MMEILASEGYLYDASVFPTFLGPLARAYYFKTMHLSEEQLEDRRELFGSLWDGFRPLKAYREQPDAAQRPAFETRFDALVEPRTGSPSSASAGLGS